MALITWKDEYSVGIEQIDEEHKAFIGMINKAYDMADNFDDQKVFAQLADDMRCYAWVHFATEEGLMIEHTYPNSQEHKAQHAEFFEMAKNAESTLLIRPTQTIKYLADWLKNHILITDKEFGEFLMSKGLK